jgi:hypothetical protein
VQAEHCLLPGLWLQRRKLPSLRFAHSQTNSIKRTATSLASGFLALPSAPSCKLFTFLGAWVGSSSTRRNGALLSLPRAAAGGLPVPVFPSLG